MTLLSRAVRCSVGCDRSLCILLFSDGPWREQYCLCFHKCAYIPLSSVLGACEQILRMWIQLPKSGFNATEMLLAKYIWVGFLSGFFFAFLRSYRSCPQHQNRCPGGQSKLGGCTEHPAFFFFCEDVTFLTHVVIRFGL